MNLIGVPEENMDHFLFKIIKSGERLSKFATKPEAIKENSDKLDYIFKRFLKDKRNQRDD